MKNKQKILSIIMVVAMMATMIITGSAMSFASGTLTQTVVLNQGAYAMAVLNGELYASTTAYQIIKVSDGSVIQNNFPATSMMTFNNELYFSGLNTTTGQYQLLKYDGTTVSLVQDRLNVYSMAVFNNELYIGGGNSVSNSNQLLKYDGTTVSLVQDNLFVSAMTVFNNELYIGGTGSQLLKYDGTSTSLVQDNFSATSIIVFNNELYIGGYNNNNIVQLLKYDGTFISVIQQYDLSGINPQKKGIKSLTIFNNELYFDFFYSKNFSPRINVYQLIKYDGTSTSLVQDNLNVSAMTVFNNELYVSDSTNNQIVKFTVPLNDSIVITGTIQPTLVQFTVPTDTSFSINPNVAYSSQFQAPTFQLSNNSNAPLQLEISNIVNDPSSTHNFTDLLPGDVTDWTKLNKTDSENKLALAIKSVNPSEYRTLTQTTDLYAKDVQSAGTPVLIGEIDPNSSVTMGLDASHGSAFGSQIVTKYKVTFVFSLAG